MNLNAQTLDTLVATGVKTTVTPATGKPREILVLVRGPFVLAADTAAIVPGDTLAIDTKTLTVQTRVAHHADASIFRCVPAPVIKEKAHAASEKN